MLRLERLKKFFFQSNSFTLKESEYFSLIRKLMFGKIYLLTWRKESQEKNTFLQAVSMFLSYNEGLLESPGWGLCLWSILRPLDEWLQIPFTIQYFYLKRIALLKGVIFRHNKSDSAWWFLPRHPRGSASVALNVRLQEPNFCSRFFHIFSFPSFLFFIAYSWTFFFFPRVLPLETVVTTMSQH